MKLELLQKKYLAYLQAHSFIGEPENLYEPINYIMNLGGKRIRPVLSMAAGLAFDAPVNDTLRLAHAIETFHNFTLVHDDIMDEAESRRGKQTVHIRNGLPTAILAGDNMLILAFQMFEGCRPDVLSVFLKTAQEVSNGQQMDMNFEESSDVTMLDYLEMIRLKTAVLLGCSCYVGAANAGADSETSHKMYAFAEQMGMVLENTASSVNIKERLDFSCAIFSPTGELVANAPHVPVHLGSMSESIKTIIRENSLTMSSGDAFLINAPYNGGTHLPDITLIKPVFDDSNEEVIFYVATRGHHADIGGTVPGSAPANSTHIKEEGVLIDNFTIVSKGIFLEDEITDLLTQADYPARN